MKYLKTFEHYSEIPPLTPPKKYSTPKWSDLVDQKYNFYLSEIDKSKKKGDNSIKISIDSPVVSGLYLNNCAIDKLKSDGYKIDRKDRDCVVSW